MLRPFLATCARLGVLAVVLAGALAPSAQAQQPEPEKVIRAGVTVAGLDVGNQTLSQAAGTIERAFLHQLTVRNVSVRVGGRSHRLTMKRLGLVFDPAKSARRAYIAGTTTPDVPVDVPVWTSLKAKRLTAFAAAVDRAARVAARDATIRITLRRIYKRSGRDGRELDEKALRAAIAATVANPAANRVIRPARKAVKPRIGVADLARAYGTVVTVDKSSFRLRLFKRLRFSKSYGVAVGMPAYPTPNGRFRVTNKAVNPAWSAPNSPWAGAYANETVPGGSAENPLKARWMGIVGGVGIHGTGAPWSIGSQASHGCIRMTVPDVIDLYPRVPVGTPVLIQ
jgi:lipoprotein-anchoring transpeptidase ErfK/SrfK